MEYTSLYRKYRPKTFDDVIGQDHVVRTLRNQIKSGNVSHAYIFTGTRGTGKTSVARIFASAVNCEHNDNGSPCGVCDSCKSLAEGNFDVMEIDAASNNSVDQMRDIIEKVYLAPSVCRYKIYIIDEAHMLSNSAFNAILKTLEEPPSHVIFILATTEIQQIPATVLSRCMRFDFRLVPVNLMTKRLCGIFDEMGIKYEKEAAELIASSGAGSVRDSLSLADTCLSFCGNDVTYNGVLEVLGVSNPYKIQQLASAVLNADCKSALSIVAELCNLGKSVPIIVNDLTTTIRNMVVIKTCGASARDILSIPLDLYSALEKLADGVEIKKLLAVQSIFADLGSVEFRKSQQHRIIFEGAVVRACLLPYGDDEVRALQAKVARLEKALAQWKR